MRSILLLSCCLFWGLTLQAQELVLSPDSPNYPAFSSYLRILVDSQRNKTLSEIRKEHTLQAYKNFEGQKLDAKYVYWFNLTLNNRSGISAWVLGLGKELNWIEVYILDSANNILQESKTGFLMPASQKTIRNTIDEYIRLELPHNQAVSLWIRIENQNKVPLSFDWVLYEEQFWKQHFQEQTLLEYAIYFVFIGMSLIMISYNFLISLINRDPVYAFYAAYMFLITLYIVQAVGLWHTFFMPEIPLSGYYIRNMGSHFGAIAYALFASHFLNIRQIAPKWYKIINILSVIMLLNFFISLIWLFFFFNVYLYKLIASILFLFNYPFWIAFAISISIQNRQNKLVRYFTFGTLILSIILFSGILVSNFIYPQANVGYFSALGVVVEIIIFSLGLGYRMKLNESEKAQMQAENARILREQNQMLEQKVGERTQEIMVQNEELRQQQEEIVAQKDFIHEQNEVLVERSNQIQDSIKAAHSIQYAILPSPQRMKKFFEAYFVFYRPKDIVSGDFYWIGKVDKTNILAVADCTGHGVSGALMTMIGNTLLDRIVRVKDVSNPAQILATLDSEIQYAFSDAETKEGNGMDIALLAWETNADQTVTVEFAGAKRPVLVFDGQTLHLYKGDRKSIDGRKNESQKFHNQHFTIPKGSIMYLFTDGFSDQNNLKREKIGFQNLVKLLETHATADLEIQKQVLERFFEEHTQHTTQRDDVLVMGIRV